jgi:hypothetical protein
MTRKAKSGLSLGVIFAFALAAALITRGDDRTSPPKLIKSEEARAALIEWVQNRNDSGLNVALPALRTGKVSDAGDGWFDIDRWSFNERTHRFVGHFTNQAFVHEISGSLRYDAKSKAWHVADLSETRS